jgi:hypothetical protein
MLLDCLPVNGDGRRRNPKMEEERQARDVFLAEQARKSRLGVQARTRGSTHGSPVGQPAGQPADVPSSSSSYSSSGSSSESIPPAGRVRVDTTGKYSEAFLGIWGQYPKKRGKGEAWKAWQRAAATVGGEQKLADLMSTALDWQVLSDDWQKDNRRYVPNCSTYLNQRRWEDGEPIDDPTDGIPYEEED